MAGHGSSALHQGGRDASALDGNVLAGMLAEAFGVDVTSAEVVCVGCTQAQRVAELVVYETAMGSTARCHGCGAVVLRAVRTRDELVLDLRGTRTLRLAVPATD